MVLLSVVAFDGRIENDRSFVEEEYAAGRLSGCSAAGGAAADHERVDVPMEVPGRPGSHGLSR